MVHMTVTTILGIMSILAPMATCLTAPVSATSIITRLEVPTAILLSSSQRNGKPFRWRWNSAENSGVVAHIFEVVPKIAAAEGLEGGYRVVSNCGDDAGQTVKHLHFHILGGRKLTLEMA